MEKNSLLTSLSALDFMATDLQLYLNTHPFDEEAIELYNSILQKASVCRKNYEEKYGQLTSFRSYNNKNCWVWNDDPWPWQEKFNLK